MTAITSENNDRLTCSRLAGVVSNRETMQLRETDWWYFATELSVSRGPTTAMNENNHLIGTAFVELPKTVRPIRKDSLSVTIGGEQKVWLQHWECVVLERIGEIVACELHDLTHESNATEYADVFVQQFNTYDVPLLVEGAVFYWSLGYLRKTKGQVINVSEFIVRRMPKLNRSQTGIISGKVDKLRGLLLR